MGQQYCDMSNKYRRSTNPQAKDFVKCFNLKTAQRPTNLQFLGAINSQVYRFLSTFLAMILPYNATKIISAT